MNKFMSKAEIDALVSDFSVRGKVSGTIGGYCEDGMPLYFADQKMGI